MTQQQKQNFTFALTVMFVVSFLLGFITTMNNSMINFCKAAFNLNAAQGQLVNTAFQMQFQFTKVAIFLESNLA